MRCLPAADRCVSASTNKLADTPRLSRPDYAAELQCTTWAQFFLKFIVSRSAVTCVIPATAKVGHLQDNLQAGYGPLPDAALRERMAKDFAR